MSKKKIFAIVLFVLVSLYMFSFASPREIDMTPINTTYTVEFVDYDGVSLGTVTVAQGEDAKYEGKELVRTADNKCNYDFNTWSEDITNVQEDLVVVAEYTCDPIGYTLTYNANGMANAVVPGNHNFNYLSATYTLVNATSPSHNFLGWFTQAVGGAKVTLLLNGSTGNRTVFGHWAIKTNAVTFNTNGGTDVLGQTIDYNNKIVKPEDPTRTGYTFNGWYSDPTLTTLWNFDDGVIAPVTLYAGWTIDTYTITYNLNGGTNNGSNPSNYDVEDTDITLLNPTRTGYTFEGWYETNDFSSAKVIEITTSRLENITLYANWNINTYTITYNSNGGTNNGSNPSNYDVEDTDITLLNPTKLGYNFLGWYETSNFSGLQTTVIDTARATNITLYAKWENSKYSMNINLNGGYTYWVSVNNYPIYPIPALISNLKMGDTVKVWEPFRTGYTFAGWNIVGDVTTNQYNWYGTNIYEFTIKAENVSITANWNTKSYNINYNTNGGVNNLSNPNRYTVETTDITLLDPTKDGYVFKGWYESSNFHGMPTTVIDTARATNITLYAKWELKPYSIIYNLNGGTNSLSNPSSYNSSTPDIVLSNPTRTGYTFEGWYETGDFSTTKITEIDTARGQDITLYANWTINAYTITFNTSGGTSIPSITQNFGTDIVAPSDPVKTGYTFGGWDQTIPATMPGNDMTINAIWNAISYTVTFDGNGLLDAVLPANMSYTIASGIPSFTAATSSTMNFLGWYTQAVGGSKVTSIPVGQYGDVTLYAHWGVKTYTVSFNTNGGSSVSSQSVSSGNKAIKPADPTKSGYDFDGWYTDDTTFNNAWNFNTLVVNDLTLYAKWTVSQHSLTINFAGGNIYKCYGWNCIPDPDWANLTRTIASGGTLVIPNPSKNNSIFDGWEVKSGNGTVLDNGNGTWTFTMGTTDTSIQAKYVPWHW